MKKISIRNRNRNIFFACIVIVPLIQFAIFYVGVNINSFFMAFRSFDPVKNEWLWVGFKNFKIVFNDIKNLPELRYGFQNSIIAFLFIFSIGISFSLLFSFYIFKKKFAYNFFRVVLFMPSIIMSIVLATILKYYSDSFLPGILDKIFGIKILGLLSNKNTIFPTMIVFYIFCNFGVSILMYAGAMDSISPSVIESAEIDGAGYFREFFSIVLPQITPTITVFVTGQVAAIFVNQLSLYSFFGTTLPYLSISTIGYYIYREIATATSYANYPTLATLGLLITIIVAPLVIAIRAIMKRLDPTGEN